MISKEHKKHSQITRPSYGSFSRNEWCIAGASDNITEELANLIIKELSPFYKCAYVGPLNQVDDATTAPDAVAVYSNHENRHLFRYNKKFSKFDVRQMFTDADLVIVNGNFHQAKAQVIVVDTSTKNLLAEKLSLLTDVQLIVLTDQEEGLFDFVKQAIPNWQELPVYRLSEKSKIGGFFRAKLEELRAPLKGMVLAGGKSTRMGSDKGSITWHDKEQRYYMADTLQNCCNEVFISCRSDQRDHINSDYKTIEDSFTGLGPYGAILSAFREQPDSAWLVTACDMPLLDNGIIRYLIDQRNPSVMATTFESPAGGFPEPLITIWEPRSYPILLSMLAQGYTCPRKALQSNDICLLKAPNADALMNVNTPEEKEKAKDIILATSNYGQL